MRAKIVAGFILFSLALGLTVLLVMQVTGKRLLVAQNYRLVEETGNGIVLRFGTHLAKVETLVQSLAQVSESLAPSDPMYRTALPDMMMDTGQESLVAGGGVWPEPFAFDASRARASYFYGRQPDGAMKYFADYNDPLSPSYQREEWYVPAKYLPQGHTFWSRSYTDPYSYEPMVTVTTPIVRNGRLWGVETIDTKLSGLAESLKQASASLGGYAFAVDRNNKLLCYPDTNLTKVHYVDDRGHQVEDFLDAPELARRQPVFEPIANVLNKINLDLINNTAYDPGFAYRMARESDQISVKESRLIAATFLDPFREMTRSSLVLKRFTVDRDLLLKEPCLVTVFHVPRAYWKVVLVTPLSRATAAASGIARTILLSLLGMLSVFLSGAFFFIRQTVSKPIHDAASALERASRAGVDAVVSLDERRADELGVLAHWVNLRTRQWQEALESLKTSEHEYRVLFENIQDLFFRSDAQGQATLVSPSVQRILGHAPADFLGRRMDELVYWQPTDRAVLMDRIQADGQVEDYEIDLKRADGERLHASLNAHVLRDAAGAFQGVEGTLRDISGRKLAERQMNRMRMYLKNIFDSMPSMLVSIDSGGTITEWNQAAASSTGVPAAAAIGRKFWDSTPLFALFKEDYQAVLRSRQARTYNRIPSLEGETRSFDATLFPLIANGVEGLVIRMDDRTEFEKVDSQLRQSQKMETVGTLAGGLAHDMNNVLCGMTGALSLIRWKCDKHGEPLSAEITGYLDLMEQSTQRAVDIIRQLLTLSRKQDQVLAAMDLNTAIHHVEQLCRSSLEKSIEIQIQPHATPAMILADGNQIEQALLNLCINGAHAMTMMRLEGAPHGGKLCLSLDQLKTDPHFRHTHPGAQEGQYWVVSVRDTGVGMDSKTLAKIFDPFFTTKDKGKGTGLGLSMVYNIVHAHGGFIDVYSEPGLGSSFNVYLPACAVAPGSDEASAPMAVPTGTGLILVVDDEPIIRSIARDILEACGYEVMEAGNGASAIETFNRHKDTIRVVLLDLLMPKLDGHRVCKAILGMEPRACILMASGFKQDERIDEAMKSGARGFVQKPYTLERLARSIAEVTQGLDVPVPPR
jgi:PAS domain S-box-containing protein